MAVCNGSFHAAVSHPVRSLGRGLELQTSRAKCQEMYAPDICPALILSHPVSHHVRLLNLNHSSRHKLTAPSFTVPETKSLRTLMTQSALKTLSRISFQAAGWCHAAMDVGL